MRDIITTTFITLDGVLQAPGGPDEDPTGGFNWGGWTARYWDEMMGTVMDGFMAEPFDLLLGRRTYEIFAAHWQYLKDDPTAELFNERIKYVVSHKQIELNWENSVLITGNIPGEIAKLKKQHTNDLWVHGSGNLIQTLLKNNMIDRMHLWIFPVTIGKGKRLFAEGTLPKGLKLVDSGSSTTGVVISTYEPAGDIVSGSFAPENPSDAELERRQKLEIDSRTNHETNQ